MPKLKITLAEAFYHCYEQWKQRLRCRVAVQGNYFEGENLICKKNKIHCLKKISLITFLPHHIYLLIIAG